MYNDSTLFSVWAHKWHCSCLSPGSAIKYPSCWGSDYHTYVVPGIETGSDMFMASTFLSGLLTTFLSYIMLYALVTSIKSKAGKK